VGRSRRKVGDKEIGERVSMEMEEQMGLKQKQGGEEERSEMDRLEKREAVYLMVVVSFFLLFPRLYDSVGLISVWEPVLGEVSGWKNKN